MVNDWPSAHFLTLPASECPLCTGHGPVRSGGRHGERAMSLPDYERLGTFYLGREHDPTTRKTGADVLYDSRDLTTHAVCIGMTGSGKTGLCLCLLEEAAIDGVPAICIDPKGDLGNLMLTFPQLAPTDFAGWVDGGEASRRNLS